MVYNVLLSLLCLTPGFSAAPQSNLQGLLGGEGLRDILKNPVIQKRILENNLNPCDGKPPTTCKCTNGQDIPCSGNARPDQCSCPNGKTFKITDLTENVINKYDLPNCGSGVEPSFCSCRDGSTFNPKTVTGPPCEGIGFNAFPKGCTCPDGQVITTNDFISKALPAILDLLG
eukprot:TRINITY_DN5909_c0_g1_i1.p1 TRINITY_DN5909_c0_g1~~TRINITY_DN5909_c0_g1_i1.p1  ORF type:complete len:173 (+),score=35.15 TRINITY_DN5909_c0_g1_i1:118-636(+)